MHFQPLDRFPNGIGPDLLWGTLHHATLTGFGKRTLLIRICCVVQGHSLCSSHRVGGHGLWWHCHLSLHSGRLSCRIHCGSVGPPLSVLWESLLLHNLCCLLCIEGGYSCRLTVLLVSPLQKIRRIKVPATT